ncbi:hypothetical protein [Pyrinomonas sp.]|uniref:hypothetical protein n=1 Tax=Pyrinomonas sp. TaxID=2080306 RepID=UPI003316E84B
MDADDLPDGSEKQVPDAFTPAYHAGNARPDTGFALFGDYAMQDVGTTFPPLLPISHFCVQPFGFATEAYGDRSARNRIDCLTP